MAKKDALVVVLGYGCHLTEPMKNYLNLVVSFAETSSVAAIIATGGYTNRKSAPGISEAGMMADYLKECVDVPVILEESSVTTNENLRSVGRIAHEQGFADKPVVVFCDSARSFKVRILARLILGHWPEIRTYELTKGLNAKLKQLLVTTSLDVLASQFPFFEKMELRRKEHIMNNSWEETMYSSQSQYFPIKT